jgi:hypothetical protein
MALCYSETPRSYLWRTGQKGEERGNGQADTRSACRREDVRLAADAATGRAQSSVTRSARGPFGPCPFSNETD